MSKRKSRKRRTFRGSCSYHLCEKRNVPLTKCQYCGEYYCSEHIRPKRPGMPRFSGTRKEDLEFMEEWRKPGGHPCPDYIDYMEKEQDRKKREYRIMLDRVIKSDIPDKNRKEPPTQSPQNEIKHAHRNNYRDKEIVEPIKNSTESEWEDIRSFWKKKSPKYKILRWSIFLFISIYILTVLLSYNSGSIFFGNVYNCSDGTSYNMCSTEKPYYCLPNGTLVKNAVICGCPPYYFEADGSIKFHN